MRSVCIILIFTSLIIHPIGHVSAAQDMFIQASAVAGLSSLGINEVNTDVAFPATIQVEINVSPMRDDPLVSRIDRAQFNSFCNKPAPDEQQILRQAWKDAFGIDVWYPYYQAKKVECWVKKKCSVRIFKLKGEPILEKGRVMYSFKTAF